MRQNHTNNLRIVVFSLASAERDILRRLMNGNYGEVLFFENDAICIDNLQTIQPDLIIVKTESKIVASRFLLTLTVTRIKCAVIFISDVLNDLFLAKKIDVCTVNCIPTTDMNLRLTQIIGATIHDDDGPSEMRFPYVGECDAIRKIRALLPALGSSSEPVLITGESGTGKELLARNVVGRVDENAAFVKVDCKNLCSKKLEGEYKHLLGFIQGMNGNERLSTADQVTVLLDNVDRLMPFEQRQVLMWLDQIETSDFSTVRGGSPKIRFIATSEPYLEDKVVQGMFRKELFHRLNVIPIHLPPLRERSNDVALLADYFSIKYSLKLEKSMVFFSDGINHLLSAYDWPGNIDELRHWSWRVITGDGTLEKVFKRYCAKEQKLSDNFSNFPEIENVATDVNLHGLSDTLIKNKSLKSICEDAVMEIERKIVIKALEVSRWNRKKAAMLLDISYKSMLNKIKNYSIN